MVGMQPQRPTSAMCSLLILFLYSSFFLFAEHLSVASDSISLGKSLSGSQTIVSRGGKFVLGFFTPGNSSKYYIGIWYKKLPVQTVIWIANREAPVTSTESSELKISQDGNLVQVNPSNIPIWSSNITMSKPNSTVAVLLDSGNLVLKESLGSSILIWQSFDHPTDTWVPTQPVGMNKVTGEYQVLTSWKNSQDPALGMFSHHLEVGGSSDYLTLWNGSVVYDHTGEWDGQAFTSIPHAALNLNFRFSFVETKERKYITCIMTNDSLLLRLVLDVSGQLKVWTWLDGDRKWMLIWSRPAVQCDVYSVCGAFGLCDQKGLTACSCLPGFEPKSLGDWDLNDRSGGCVRRSPLQCGDSASPVGGQADVFSVMPDVKFPTSPQNLSVANAEECKRACSSNCSCSAYAYDGACLIWIGQLHNLQQLSKGDSDGGVLYLRLAASEQPQLTSHKSKILLVVTVGSIFGFLLFFLVLSAIIYRYRRRASGTVAGAVDGSLIQFKYSDLLQITKKFSVLLGKGGFGSVFAGVLPDSTHVAVKRLQAGMRQGEKQFLAEVRTLGTIQHANLVRLRGFCAERDKRLLVYDYMPNGSLDSHLFVSKHQRLDWTTRYQIALGTARGLAYLHEECRERIIHCDIKPENILLDESYRPKVADFGMAKLITRDFSRALTTMRGTRGYLAPEWVSGLAITPKVDVYSFGMVLFELISGRRNTEMRGGGKATSYFPFLVAHMMNEGGDLLSLLDHKLEAEADVEELTKVCKAACWCIQDEESCRPTMGQVVRILEGVLVAGVPPIPRSLLNCLQLGNDSDSM